MKIKYDGFGNIYCVRPDTDSMSGSNVSQVADIPALSISPYSYTFKNGTLSIRQYLSLSTTKELVNGIASAKADGVDSIIVTVSAHKPDGTVDQNANLQVYISDRTARNGASGVPAVPLVNGTASVTFTSFTPKTQILTVQQPEYFGSFLEVCFI